MLPKNFVTTNILKTKRKVALNQPVGRVVAEGVTRLFIDAERRICNPPYGLQSS